jgi:acyl-CoA synthetase (AMP-forming)/AMP-acid ligase II
MMRWLDGVFKHAAQRPQALALHFAGLDFTWSDFARRLRQSAGALAAMGVGRGTRVAYLGFNSHQLVELMLAPSALGAMAVSLNHRLAEAELIDIVQDAQPQVLVVDLAHVAVARRVWAACPELAHLVVAALDAADGPEDLPAWEALLQASPAPTEADLQASASASDEALIVFYTSGTTGRPKGVMLSHNNLLANAMAIGPVMGFGPQDRILFVGPLFHLGTGGRVFTAVFYGMAMIVQQRFEVLTLAQAVAEQRVTTMTLVPTMLRMLLDHPEFARFDWSSLRLLTYGAAPMPPALLARAMAAIAGIAFCQSYGMTEASPVLALLTPEDHVGPPAKLSSVGRPVASADVRIRDPQGQDLPTGVTGEIVARGPQIMLGYWRQPEATAAVMQDGFYRTGDAGWLDADGHLYVVGRLKEMIISGGENIYPVEVENVLSRHPAVAQAAVFGLPDAHWGEVVHAVVALHAGQTPDAPDLIDFVRGQLAHYKAPRHISVWPEALPLLPTNKLDKARLRAHVLAQREASA